MQNLALIYKAFYASNDCIDFKDFKDFVELYCSKNEQNKDSFDMSILTMYEKDPAYIEKQLLKLILELNNIPLELEYLTFYIYKMSVRSISDEGNNGILMDELFSYTISSFLLTVFSLSYDSSSQNFERCFKNLIVTLDLQGRRKIIGTHNKSEFSEMLCMPQNVLSLASDAYWCIFSFIIGHELYHLMHKDEKSSLEDELNADRFGYTILINMIEFQKVNQIPKELQVYSENLYLSPVMFLEYFRLYDYFQGLCDANSYTHSPFSPELRERLIIESYFEDIPESFNTDEGNDLLNNFLDAVDMLEEQLKIKFNNGKLDLIINKH